MNVVLRVGDKKRIVDVAKPGSRILMKHLGQTLVYELSSIDDQLRPVYVLKTPGENPPASGAAT